MLTSNIANKLNKIWILRRARTETRSLVVTCTVLACLTPSCLAQQSLSAVANKADEPNGNQKPSVRPQVGISGEQADAILAELRQIRRLLEQRHDATFPTGTPSENVRISVEADWHVMGNNDAPVTIVEFTDLQCSFCRRFHVETFPMIKKDYIDTGKVRFISRDMPLEFHQHALKAAEAVRCAGEQKKFWEMRDAILESAAPLNEEFVLNLAKSLLPDFAALHTCLASERYKAVIERDTKEATALQISGTPTFVIARTTRDTLDGVRMVGALSHLEFQIKIDSLLNRP